VYERRFLELTTSFEVTGHRTHERNLGSEDENGAKETYHPKNIYFTKGGKGS
jgi:hypothetical protein